MKTLAEQVASEINEELERLPEKYANSDFNSAHEGLAVIEKQMNDLRQEVYYGMKNAIWRLHQSNPESQAAKDWHKRNMRKQAIQLAAMCVRFIQELT